MRREYSVYKYPGCVGCFDFVVKVLDGNNKLSAIFKVSDYNHRPEFWVKNLSLSTGQFGYELNNIWNKFIRYVNSDCSQKVLDDINEFDNHLFD